MPTTISVTEGDCLSRLAEAHGFSSYAILYNHGDNAALKEKRPNPNMLVVGDAVVVPDLEVKQVEVAAGAKHSFKVTRRLVKLRLVVIDEDDKPVANKPYRLLLGGEQIDGTTSAKGLIEREISAQITAATLILDPDKKPPEPAPEEPPPPAAASPDPPPYPPPIEPAAYRDKLDPAFVGADLFPVTFALSIGALPSFNETIGVQARLVNLGFSCRGEWGDVGEGTTAAVKAYQRKYGGGDSGAPADIQDAIRDRHDKVP